MDRLLSFISLARRAGAAKCGANEASACARAGKARLLILAADASPNTKKEAQNMAAHKGIRLVEEYTKEELGKATGRAETSLIAVASANMAENIWSLYNAKKKEGDVHDKVQNS